MCGCKNSIKKLPSSKIFSYTFLVSEDASDASPPALEYFSLFNPASQSLSSKDVETEEEVLILMR